MLFDISLSSPRVHGRTDRLKNQEAAQRRIAELASDSAGERPREITEAPLSTGSGVP